MISDSVTIDIVIPSFRAQKEYILPILHLTKPAGAIINFYLIIDDPAIKPAAEIVQAAKADDIHLIINPENLGASMTRNKGIDSGTGEWVLFLDDDITIKPDLLCIYKQAIDRFEGEIGFIGLVTLPPAETAYTQAIMASGSGGVFSVALHKEYFSWGATANIMLKRAALGSVRFSALYPKAGGGEDVDFFLKVRQANNYKDFKTLKEAEVWHPWWKNGQVNLTRAYRYGQGTGWLIDQNPQYTRYDFLSTIETLAFSVLLLIACLLFKPAWAQPVFIFIIGVCVAEVVANLVNSLRKKQQHMTPLMLLYVILLKNIYDFGVLSINLSNGLFKGLGKRFNDNGSLKKIHFIRFNRYKITKVILYTLLLICLFYYYS